MAKDSDNLAKRFDAENTGGVLSGLLAEEDEFDRRALWRLGSWAVGSVAAVVLALLASQSSTGTRRDQMASADLARQSQQVEQLARDVQKEAGRLASAVDILNNDRDRLYSRVAVLEQGLDSVTGAISRRQGLQPAPAQTGSLGTSPTAPSPIASSSGTASPIVASPTIASQGAALSGVASPNLGSANVASPSLAPGPSSPGPTSPGPSSAGPSSPGPASQSPPPPSTSSPSPLSAIPAPAASSVPAAVSAAAAPTTDPSATVQKPSPAPVASPVVTTTAAAVEKPPIVASGGDPAPAAASSAAASAPAVQGAISPVASLVTPKSIMGPPDPAASKLIEPGPAAKAIAAAPLPEVVASAQPVEDVAEDEQASAVKSAVQRTEFGVDVGGANSIPGLRALWRGLLRSKSNAQLAALRPIIVIREGRNGLGMQLRLVAGPISDAATAAKICAAMMANDRNCTTAVFEGQRLAMNADEPAAAAEVNPASEAEAKSAPGLKPSAHKHYAAKRSPKEESAQKPEPSGLSSIFGRTNR